MTIRKQQILLLALLITLGFAVRFAMFTDRIDFSLDSSQDLSLAARIAYDHKPTLLGPPVGSRAVSGMYFYIGPLYPYFLAVLELLSHFDPILITALYALFNIAFGLFFFHLVAKKVSLKAAYVALLFYLFDPLMVRLSLTIWNPILTVPVALLSWYFYPKAPFLLGVLSGVGLSLHYSYLLPAIFLGGLLFLKRFKTILPYILGIVLGELPLLIFELRHNFFITKAIATYVRTTLSGNGNTHLTPIDFAWGMPFIFLGLSLGILFLAQKSNAFAIIALSLVTASSFYSVFLQPRTLETFGMPTGWTIREAQKAARIIAADATDQFEVASLIKGDTRDYPIRYYLEYVFHKKPTSVEAYPSANVMYVVARSREQIEHSTVWELTAPGPHRIETVWPLNNDISLYKLHFPYSQN